MSKTFIHFFTIADYEDEEQWLRNKHKNGWKFVKFTLPCFYTFEECTPEDVIYRLDFIDKSASEDYIQMFQDYGWEYKGNCIGWIYFCKPLSKIESEKDGEIFSDLPSHIHMIEQVIKTRLLPIIVICCFIILPNFFTSFTDTFGKARIFFMIVFSLLLVLYLFLIIHCGRKLTKLRKRFERES